MTVPLSLPQVSRERLHSRTVTFDGYRRRDGLFDIEAHLVDVKDHDFALLTGIRPAGVPVHDMWVRVTIDRAFVIHAVEAVTDSSPIRARANASVPRTRSSSARTSCRDSASTCTT